MNTTDRRKSYPTLALKRRLNNKTPSITRGKSGRKLKSRKVLTDKKKDNIRHRVRGYCKGWDTRIIIEESKGNVRKT